MKISFCIITLNEEANLSRCLSSCRDLADEILVLDSGSTDGTASIAREHGARFEFQPWPGYVAQKNRVLELATNDWVFSLDADEELSPELRAEILQLKNAGPPSDTAGFSLPRCVFYEGRWIRHGDWYPDRLVRCFYRRKARFDGGKVHERLLVDGPVREWKGELRHYSFRDAADHLDRCRKYARLWAESQHESGRKASWWSPAGHAGFRWLRSYIFRGGWLDGSLGLRIANFAAYEVWLKYSTLRALNK
ncbi:MAG: glycosyltransferase family 2 protein [Verrucomicrobia bacterium]|nr:glycosyltransferase family 2 protein [Verrucomicrobiota bacterium]